MSIMTMVAARPSFRRWTVCVKVRSSPMSVVDCETNALERLSSSSIVARNSSKVGGNAVVATSGVEGC